MKHAIHHQPLAALIGAIAHGVVWRKALSRSRHPAYVSAGMCAANRPFKRVFAAI